LPLFLPLLLKLAKARSSCAIARKNLITIVQPSCMMCKRGKEREGEKERSRSLFFRIVVKWKCSLPGVELFLSLSFFLFLLLCARFFSRSLAHSRGFAGCDNWVRWKRSFHSNFFFLHIHTHIDILREMADTLSALFDLLWFTSTRWYQLLSAGNNNKYLLIWVFYLSLVIQTSFLI
jgi:hypothetical protein